MLTQRPKWSSEMSNTNIRIEPEWRDEPNWDHLVHGLLALVDQLAEEEAKTPSKVEDAPKVRRPTEAAEPEVGHD